MPHILRNDQRCQVTAAALAVGVAEGAGGRPPFGRSLWRVDASMPALLLTTRG